MRTVELYKLAPAFVGAACGLQGEHSYRVPAFCFFGSVGLILYFGTVTPVAAPFYCVVHPIIPSLCGGEVENAAKCFGPVR